MRRAVAVAALIAAQGGSAVQAQNPAKPISLAAPSPAAFAMFAKNASVAAGISADQKLRVWEVASARVTHTIDLAGRDIALVAMSDDGRHMLAGDYRAGMTVWSSASAAVEFEQRFARYLTAAAFSHDGRLVAVAPGSPARVYELATKKMLYELRPSAGTNAIAFSRDDALIASGDGDAVRIYDARTGKFIAENSELLADPLALAFTPDGKQVVAAGSDATVLLIDAATGKTIQRMAKTADPIFYVEVSPNGREVAVVTLKADNPALPAPVVFADLPSLKRNAEWPAPAGVLVPGGAAWTPDGHFMAATSTPTALQLWRVR